MKKNKDRIEKNNGTYREEDGFMPEGTHNELMTDFATEEFINKNIRVRPSSGITAGGGEKDE